LGAGANPWSGWWRNPGLMISVLFKNQNHKNQNFDYEYGSNSPKKERNRRISVQDEQNKAGIDELPDSSEYIYNLETKTARKALKTVWKNTTEKVLAGLDKMNSGKLLPQQKKL
jgi:hypothetical protein